MFERCLCLLQKPHTNPPGTGGVLGPRKKTGQDKPWGAPRRRERLLIVGAGLCAALPPSSRHRKNGEWG